MPKGPGGHSGVVETPLRAAGGRASRRRARRLAIGRRRRGGRRPRLARSRRRRLPAATLPAATLPAAALLAAFPAARHAVLRHLQRLVSARALTTEVGAQLRSHETVQRNAGDGPRHRAEQRPAKEALGHPIAAGGRPLHADHEKAVVRGLRSRGALTPLPPLAPLALAGAVVPQRGALVHIDEVAVLELLELCAGRMQRLQLCVVDLHAA